MKQNIINHIKIITVAVVVGLSVGVFAFAQFPQLPPPQGNVAAPINVSPNEQTKPGRLNINNIFTAFSIFGNEIIGGWVAATNGLQFTGGNPGLNKILASDATGNASWKTAQELGLGAQAQQPQNIDPFSNTEFRYFSLVQLSTQERCPGWGDNGFCAIADGRARDMLCPSLNGKTGYIMSGGVRCGGANNAEIRASIPTSSTTWQVECDSTNEIEAANILCMYPGPITIGDSSSGSGGSGGTGTVTKTWTSIPGSGLQAGNANESCLAWVRRVLNDSSIQSADIRIWYNGGYQTGQCNYRDTSLSTATPGSVNPSTFSASNRRPTSDYSLQVFR